MDPWIKILFENRANINKLKLRYHPDKGGNGEDFDTLKSYLDDLDKICPRWREKVENLGDMATLMRGEILKKDALTFLTFREVSEQICAVLGTVVETSALPAFTPDGFRQEDNGFISESVDMYIKEFAEALKCWKELRVTGYNDHVIVSGPKRYLRYSISKDYPWKAKLVDLLRSAFDGREPIQTLEEWLMVPSTDILAQFENQLPPRSDWEGKIFERLKQRNVKVKERKESTRKRRAAKQDTSETQRDREELIDCVEDKAAKCVVNEQKKSKKCKRRAATVNGVNYTQLLGGRSTEAVIVCPLPMVGHKEDYQHIVDRLTQHLKANQGNWLNQSEFNAGFGTSGAELKKRANWAWNQFKSTNKRNVPLSSYDQKGPCIWIGSKTIDGTSRTEREYTYVEL